MATLLQIHVWLSLIGIAAGLVFLYGLLAGRIYKGLTAIFLLATVLTSVTGFPLPPYGIDPPRIVGVISLSTLAAAILALYVFALAGNWRRVFIVSAVASLYLNVFVGVVQAFQKLSFLQPLAPTQSEPPFLISQIAVLALFVALGFLAMMRFHPALAPRA